MPTHEEFYPELATTSDMRTFMKEGGVLVGVDVDTQRDFAEEGGALYVPTSPEVKSNLSELTQRIPIQIGSVDSHAYDAWEFQENGGPFPPHCVKGTEGWLKIPETRRPRMRFIPMSDRHLVIGENEIGRGNRKYGEEEFAREIGFNGVSGIFEKENYSLFTNPNAQPFLGRLSWQLTRERRITRDKILFGVFGHCTGGYCVDAAATGLRVLGYRTAIIEDATAPLNINHTGEVQDGAEATRRNATEKNIHILRTHDFLEGLA